MTNPERRERIREELIKLYLLGRQSRTKIISSNETIDHCLSALEALMPGTDYIQALEDVLEQASIEISHYKDEIEKQAVEIESLEFKLKAKPVMTKEAVMRTIYMDISEHKRFDCQCEECEAYWEKSKDLASKLIGRE